MRLDLEKSTWKHVRLGDVIRRSRKQLDPFEAGIDRYIGGGHIDGDSITIDRWGDPNDGQMGSTFRYVFEPGQTLFVSARPYLRKSGVVDFSGVVADKTYVLDAIPESGLLQEFLPFILASDPFIEYATAEATGSMNPRLLWGPFQRYELDLPPLDEQKRIADLLWAIERHRDVARSQTVALQTVRNEYLAQRMGARHETWMHRSLGEFVEVIGGGTPKTTVAEYWDGDIPWLTPGDLTSRDGQRVFDTERHISQSGLEHSAAKLLPEGTVLVTTRATIGVVGLAGAPLATNQGFQSLICGEEVLPEYLLRWVQINRSQLMARAGGSTFLEIGARAIRSIPIDLPPVSDQRGILQDTAVAEEANKKVEREIEAITSLHDAAMRDVFGGD